MPGLSSPQNGEESKISDLSLRGAPTLQEVTQNENRKQPPQLELRFGGLHLTLQRIPAWLVTLITAAATGAGAWWTHR